ncbi:CapA family protein [Geomonas anaerohicana]|uniref:CapA family protein n=1 Tax=Geomonas anaerohicana TaxID=2798583 RepID=A0ABS0YBZ2_9BACT|nr:CapA family protein [Geomonas anaerohicana]MBJ6749830.1 CapA family protein [Geomonas anaerohicana]
MESSEPSSPMYATKPGTTGRTVTLMAAGDLCPADHYFTLGHGFADPARVEEGLGALAPLLQRADIAIANLECPLTKGTVAREIYEQKAFLGSPAAAPIIKRVGVGVLHVANNHVLQHGRAAFEETLDNLLKAGIQPVGHSVEGQAINPSFHNIANLHLGFIAVSLVPDRRHNTVELTYDKPEVAQLADCVSSVAATVDHLIVSIHWGAEGPSIPSSAEISLGRHLIESGASVILGHHSHVVRPVERWENGLIFYSLGNLLFDLEWSPQYSLGVVAEIRLGPKGSRASWDLHFCRCRGGKIHVLNSADNKAAVERLDELKKFMDAESLEGIDAAHDRAERNLEKEFQIRKTGFFVRNFFKGNTRAKASFLFHKLLG